MRVVQHEIDAGTAGISAWVNKLTNTRHSIWLNNCIRGQDLDASALRGALFVLCGSAHCPINTMRMVCKVKGYKGYKGGWPTARESG
eukprot:1104046-Pelagomonas_calceolata.AAC.1